MEYKKLNININNNQKQKILMNRQIKLLNNANVFANVLGYFNTMIGTLIMRNYLTLDQETLRYYIENRSEYFIIR